MVFLEFFYSQLFVTPPDPVADLTGQVIIVTGSNVGLGLEAARHLVRLKAGKVILAVRNVEKGETARRSIEQSTQRTGVVEVWPLDLSSYASVEKFAERAKALPRLDVLLENAGIATDDFMLCEDNESTITVNVVSTFLLALLLLPKLRETAVTFSVLPRLVIVSSDVHQLTNLPEKKNPSIFEALNNKEKARMWDRYVSFHVPPLPKPQEAFKGREKKEEHLKYEFARVDLFSVRLLLISLRLLDIMSRNYSRCSSCASWPVEWTSRKRRRRRPLRSSSTPSTRACVIRSSRELLTGPRRCSCGE